MKRTAILRRTPLKRGKTRLRSASPKRAKQLRAYSTARKQFLVDHPICEVWCSEHNWGWWSPGHYCSSMTGVVVTADRLTLVGAPLSIEIHHRAGRIGEKLNDQSDWLAVSRDGHDRIHRFPKEARARGWLK